jgi:hypothetical protein
MHYNTRKCSSSGMHKMHLCTMRHNASKYSTLRMHINSQYRQKFRACGGLRGNLITPSRTRPPRRSATSGTYPLRRAPRRRPSTSAVCRTCQPRPAAWVAPEAKVCARGFVNKVGQAVCRLRFDNSERIIANLGPTFRDLSIGTLASCASFDRLAAA